MRTPLPYGPEPFDCLVADPPWRFGDSLPGPKRGSSKHYKTLNVRDIESFPIPVMANPSILFLWRVASMQAEALRVIDAWGFTLKSELVWVKTVNVKDVCVPAGLCMGMGHYVRGSHEMCLIATRGSFKVQNRSTHSVFYTPRQLHSEKPDEFYSIVEKLVGPSARKVELFSRWKRAGWECFGDEVGGRTST